MTRNYCHKLRKDVVRCNILLNQNEKDIVFSFHCVTVVLHFADAPTAYSRGIKTKQCETIYLVTHHMTENLIIVFM